jgi:hypothetical protein
MLAQLFTIIAPVLACAALGFTWKRLGRPFDTQMVSAVVTNIATPCLIVGSLSRLKIDAAAFGIMAGATAAAILLFLLVGWAVLRAARLPAHTYLPSMAFANSGNLGLPLCLFAFGETGLALGIAVFTVNSVTQFTIGQLLSAGRFSPRILVRSPIIYALAVGLVILLAKVQPPEWALNAVTLLGGMAIPLMLLALGVSLASLEVGDVGRSAALSCLRIFMGLAIGLALAEILGLTGAARGVLIIQCAMPAAVFNFLFAQHYQRDASAVAGVVVVSTVLAFVLMPLVLALALDPALMPWR